MLATGAHGSLGIFFGFAMILFANALISAVMLNGNIFSRPNSYIGIVGNSLMVTYVVLVTFIPTVEKLTLAFAMPAGLLVMVWIFMCTRKLFKSGNVANHASLNFA